MPVNTQVSEDSSDIYCFSSYCWLNTENEIQGNSLHSKAFLNLYIHFILHTLRKFVFFIPWDSKKKCIFYFYIESCDACISVCVCTNKMNFNQS